MQCPVCGLAQDEIPGLIGPLCDECVAICVEIVGAMIAFSPALEQSIQRAVTFAAEGGDDDSSYEYLLLALIDDPEAARVMQACNVDFAKLRESVLSSLPPAGEAAVGEERSAAASRRFNDVIQRPAARVLSVRSRELTGTDVLLEVLSSTASGYLLQQGMTWYDAVSFLSHGIVKGTSASRAVAIEGAAEASTFTVVLLNDDYTPMEFVVHVLQKFFDLERETATQVMLRVHEGGRGDCGTYPSETAKAKAAQVLDFARQHGHPLRCVLRAAS